MNAVETCQLLTVSMGADRPGGWEDLESTIRQSGAPPALVSRLRTLAFSGSGASSLGAPDPNASGPCLRDGDVVANRYVVDSFLAHGGMGEVYRAVDRLLDVTVALKVIRSGVAADSESTHRFKQEVLLARAVSHPNVCRIYDIGWDERRELSYLTMELLPGRTLREMIRAEGPLSATATLGYLRDMVAALEAAHRVGIVHRDFKSGNVMIVPASEGNRAVVMDFGLAVDALGGVDSTDGSTPPALVGTPAYMAPEQVTGERMTPATDLYALGVVLFEMLTGRLPFERASALECAMAHVVDAPPALARFAVVDERWHLVVVRLLEKAPEDRFARAGDVLAALEGELPRPSIPNSLPPERDAFVGREPELLALTAALEGGDAPDTPSVVSILGMGGIGKTRLAVAYGTRSLSRWPGGVWFCDLGEADTPDGVTRAVATGLDVPLGRGEPWAQLGHVLAARGEGLVILDNAEQVREWTVGAIRVLSAAAKKARFLVTSRERLQVDGERVIALEPLPPDGAGVELFAARARRRIPGFEVDASNRSLIESLVAGLDGLPLAIELAASRLRMMGVRQIHDRLHDRLRLLSDRSEGRHGAIRATLDWSWDLLAPEEQDTLCQVSMFEGGFTLEAAEAVVDLASHPTAPEVLDLLEALVDKSWLRLDRVGERPRFDLFATVRDYGLARLRDRGGEAGFEAASGRQSEYFARMGEASAIDDLHGASGRTHREDLFRDLPNLVAASRRAVARGDQAVAGRAFRAATEALILRGPLQLAVHLGLEVVAVCVDPAVRADALRTLAGAEQATGRLEDAARHHEEALLLCRQAGDRRGEALVLGDLARVEQARGQFDLALTHYREALAGHRDARNRRGEGVALSNLGILHFHQGRLAESRTCYEEALALQRAVGDRRYEAAVLGNLGGVVHVLGDIEAARRHHEAALALHRDLGDRRFEGYALGNLGSVLSDLDRLDEALEFTESALAIHREVGDRLIEGVALGNLGELQQRLGDTWKARQSCDAALAIHREVGNRIAEAHVLGTIADLLYAEGRTPEAHEALNRAEAIAAEFEMAADSELGRRLGSVRKTLAGR